MVSAFASRKIRTPEGAQRSQRQPPIDAARSGRSLPASLAKPIKSGQSLFVRGVPAHVTPRPVWVDAALPVDWRRAHGICSAQAVRFVRMPASRTNENINIPFLFGGRGIDKSASTPLRPAGVRHPPPQAMIGFSDTQAQSCAGA